MSIGEWEPLWLGAAPRRLYGALHRGAVRAPLGVVLVPPLLHEQPRSRRFLVEVASEFAQLGLHCLRFDFYGSGDSDGESQEADFRSMKQDLDIAVSALRERTRVSRVAMIGWRGSALPLQEWVHHGGPCDLVALWEPIVDGHSWLDELVSNDESERALRSPPRAGIPRLTDPSDGQLMGFGVSSRLRADLANASSRDSPPAGIPRWAVVRTEASALPFGVERLLHLPNDTPGFGSGAAMDATFFLTPPMRELVVELGNAMRLEATA